MPLSGLTSFDREQARWFFGRDELVADLVDGLGRRLHTGGLQMVIGPSGAGKSSVLRAGLLPGLGQGVLPGSARWPQSVFTPAAAPLRVLAEQSAELIAALTGAAPESTADLLTALTADPHRCAELLARALEPQSGGAGPEGRAVIVVDQFEELFTLCPDDAQRRTFIDLLTRLADPPAGGSARRDPLASVVVGVRADFYAACTDYPKLRPALQDPLVVTGMSEEQLREAIVYPAQAVGLDIEEGLTEILLRDLGTAGATGRGEAAGYEAGRLPLLAYALQRSWQQRHGSTLTVQGYRSTGGIERAIATTAERVFTGLDPAGQEIARLLFLRLVKIGDGTDDTRHRLSRDEVPETGADRRAVSAVVDAFTRERLLTQRQDTVEITHEALIRGWPRLRSWIETDRSTLLVRQQLAEDAAAWHRHGDDDAYLYADSRLAAAQSLENGSWGAGLSPTERGFLAASVHRSRRRARQVHQVIATLTALFLLAAGPTRPLGARMIGHAGSAEWVAYRHDGRVLATASGDSTARLWDVSDPDRPKGLATLKGHTRSVKSVKFDPQRSMAATASYDGTVRLWDISDPRSPRQITVLQHGDRLSRVAFSPDGKVIAVSSDEGTARLWEVSDPSRPKDLATLKGHRDRVISLVFAPHGRLLATSSADATLRLWDVSDPARSRHLGTAVGHGAFIYDVAFSPDGRMLASGSTDGTARLWDIADPKEPRPLNTLTGFPNTVTGVAFSPDGRTLATASADGSARLWDISDPTRVSRVVTLAEHTSAVKDADFSRDGRILATASGDKTARLWDVSDPARSRALSTLKGHSDVVTAVRIGPDGRTAATVSSDHTGRLWDVSDPSRPALITRFQGHDDALESVAFSPGGRLLVTTGRDGATIVWDVSRPRDPQRLSTLGVPDNWVNAASFSPDGRILAIGSGSSVVSLWDLSDPARPKPLDVLKGHTNGVSDVRFSPDGTLLATSAHDGTARLWRVSRPEKAEPVSVLQGHSSSVTGVAFSPDGELVTSTSEDGTVQLWSTDTEAAQKRACSASGMPINRTEWSRYIPDLPYDPPC